MRKKESPLAAASVEIPRVIHPTAIIDPKATIGANVSIGPYCVIGSDVELGDGCVLHSHVILGGPSRIGRDNQFFPFAAVGGKSQDLKYEGEPTCLEIGDRNVFRENATVHRGTHAHTPTRIGSDNLFLCYSHVAHDCQVGSHVILSNNGTLGGHVEVEDHAIISGLAAVHQFCRIGCHSIIGGCAKVTQDVPPYMIIDGNPAVTRGLNLVGLQRRGFTGEDIKALKAAYKKLFLKKDANLATALSSLKADRPANHEPVRHLIDFIEGSKRGVAR
ncbi:MAG: Acyl-[acyl-carrier-protein]--UDP-N-acetylglucosamine O-acyltransferase [Akkermansiaceae bacterium]|nr:Acyl-[acyl-carrier-protein]--UDP-N-acetylglucosamine O-acyltransferase [Akkermansiaceae bacterium]